MHRFCRQGTGSQLLQSGHELTLVSRRLPRGYGEERSDGRLCWLQLDPAQPGSWQEPAAGSRPSARQTVW